MINNSIIKIFSSASLLAKNAIKIVKNKGAQCIEQEIIKGHYVTREEFDQLSRLVNKLDKKIK